MSKGAFQRQRARFWGFVLSHNPPLCLFTLRSVYRLSGLFRSVRDPQESLAGDPERHRPRATVRSVTL